MRAEGSESASRQTLGSLEARVHAATERREVRERERKSDEHDPAATPRKRSPTSRRSWTVSTELAAEPRRNSRPGGSTLRASRRNSTPTHADQAAAQARLDALEEVAELLADIDDAVARLQSLGDPCGGPGEGGDGGENEAAGIVTEAEAAVEEAWLVVARHDEELRRLDAHMSGAAERFAGKRRKRETREIELAALNEELARVQEALAQAERAADRGAGVPSRTGARPPRRPSEARTCRGLQARCCAFGGKNRRAGLRARLRWRRAPRRSGCLRPSCDSRRPRPASPMRRRRLQGLRSLRASLTEARNRARAVSEAACYRARGRPRLGNGGRGACRRGASQGPSRRRAARVAAAARTGARGHARRRGAAKEQGEVRRAEMRARIEALGERALDEWGLTVEHLKSLEQLDAETEEIEPHAGRGSRAGPEATRCCEPKRRRGVRGGGEARDVPRRADEGSRELRSAI